MRTHLHNCKVILLRKGHCTSYGHENSCNIHEKLSHGAWTRLLRALNEPLPDLGVKRKEIALDLLYEHGIGHGFEKPSTIDLFTETKPL